MRLLSIDVGIKNMGVCLLEYDAEAYIKSQITQEETHIKINKLDFIKIIDWKVIDILEKYSSKSHLQNNNCCFIQKNKNKCQSKAVYYGEKQSNDTNNTLINKARYFFCNKHSKQTKDFFQSNNSYNKSFFQEKTIQQLIEFKNKTSVFLGNDNVIEKKISSGYKLNKKELVDELYNYVNLHKLKTIVKPKACDLRLVDVGIIINQEFNEWLGNRITSLDCVVIENQISPIANRMKTVQGMISQYFIMKGIINIRFISSSNKLNNTFQQQLNNDMEINSIVDEINVVIPTGKKHYKERKTAGLALSFNIIKNLQDKQHHKPFIDYFESHTKKDDLADSLLQGLWCIYNDVRR